MSPIKMVSTITLQMYLITVPLFCNVVQYITVDLRLQVQAFVSSLLSATTVM